MARIVLISDIHLSPTHGIFWGNWVSARDAANQLGGALTIVSGDLAINGPEPNGELQFAAGALQRLASPVHAIPGNHDVGDEPPGQDPNQLIDDVRLARWRTHFGADRFATEAGGWLIIGLNAQLAGSGLPAEIDQRDWLADQLAAAAGRPIMVVLHKPLFLDDPAETTVGATTINPEPRRLLMTMFKTAGVRLIVSGHLHCHRDVTLDGIRYLWLPATSFLGSPALPEQGRFLGLTTLDLEPNRLEVAVHRPAMEVHDLDVIKGHGRYAFLRDMPPSPPPSNA